MNSKEFFDTYGKGAVVIYSYGFRDAVMTEEKGCE